MAFSPKDQVLRCTRACAISYILSSSGTRSVLRPGACFLHHTYCILQHVIRYGYPPHQVLEGKDIVAAQAKQLLQLLSEISDPEIILLQFYAKIATSDQNAYIEKHKSIIQGPVAHMGSTPEELDQAALHSTRKAHLERLELIRPNFRSPQRGQLPEFDDKTGMMKVSYHSITWLGRLLLRFTDLDDGMKSR